MAEEDMIFGKNRHFFGGIEPSNMSRFKVSYKSGINEIDARLPLDTVINGQTLCTVAGAVIRRSTDRYPTNEFDGELVADITTSEVIIDDTIDPSLGYYYAAFPYTTQGVYNRNPANRDSVNIPDNIKLFSAKSQYDYKTEESSVELKVELPANVAGAVIRKSQNGYPETETDGDEFMTVTASGSYSDTNVTLGETYYYSIFTYSSVGVYNRNIASSVKVTCAKYNYLFGYDLDLDDPDPLTRVTYPEDVDNAKFKAAFMNYGYSEFDYGDWPNTPGKYFMPRPCMLTYDGVVAEYLDPTDYTKIEDGVHSSKVADFTFNGSAMMEWPKIYTKRDIVLDEGSTVNGVYRFRCSDTPQGDDWDCWCNYDGNDNIVDNFYTSIYMATYEDVSTGTDLRSMSGKIVSSGEQITTFRSRARYNGSSTDASYLTWDIGLMADYLLIRDLLVMMAKTTDCQKAYGNGRGNANKAVTTTGELNNKGMFWGSDKWSDGVKVFGMENWWGNYAQHIAGWNLVAGIERIKITKGAHDGKQPSTNPTSASMKHIIFGPDYYSNQISASAAHVGSDESSGYISSMTDYVSVANSLKFGLIPTGYAGSNTTYECDWIRRSNSTSTSTQYSYTVGGNYSYSVQNGPFCAVAVSDIESPSYTGAFLSYKPLV